MPRCASKEVRRLYLNIHAGLIPLLGDVETTQKDRSKTVKTPIEIHIKSSGFPELPAITTAHGYKTKVVQAMLREYCTAHIREPSSSYLCPCVTHTLIRLCVWKKEGNNSMGKAVQRSILVDYARLCSRWVSVGRPI
jgi:hypothetical protein